MDKVFDKDENLAKEWQQKSAVSSKESPSAAKIKAAQWLSNGKVDTLTTNEYRLRGILADWKNPEALKENNYNQAPMMSNITRGVLYKPHFSMTNPNDIPINDYYDAIATTLGGASQPPSSSSFPRYLLINSREQ